jgi:uncharacterized repeat protein (TIGR01451 family)
MEIFPIKEKFDGNTVPSGWKLFGNATIGGGWLRLVPAKNDQAGTAFLNQAFPSALGISVEFDLAAWGGKVYEGSVGDGISFYLIDGAKDLKHVGGIGGALGYASHHPSKTQGVNDGYVGIGFDQWGAFSDKNHAGTGGPGRHKNHAVIRGSGDENTGFAYVKGAELPQLTLTRDNPVRIHLTIIKGKITVGVQQQSGLVKLIDGFDLTTVSGQKPLPPTLKLGLSASTGGATNNYEIRNLTITLPVEMPVTMDGPTEVFAGELVSYTIKVENKGPNVAQDAFLQGAFDAHLQNVKVSSCKPTNGAECGQATDGNNFKQPLKLPVGGSAEVTISSTAPTDYVGTTTNTVTAGATTGTNTSSQRTATVQTNIKERAYEMPVTMDGPTEVFAGELVSYTIKVENKGPNVAQDAFLQGAFDTLYRSRTSCVRLTCRLRKDWNRA